MHQCTKLRGMRLTVNLKEPYYRAAKALSKAEDCSLSTAVNRLIAAGFEAHTPKLSEKTARNPSFPTSPGRLRVTADIVEQIEENG